MINIKALLLRSGPCIDSVPVLRLYLSTLRTPALRWAAILSRLKFSPSVLDAIRASGLKPEEQGALFSEAMNIFRSGPTFKTTGAARTPLTDAAMLRAVRPGDLVLDAGASDGSSSAALLGSGAEVLVTDRQASYAYADKGPFRLFYGAEEGLLSVRLPGLYVCTGILAGSPPEGASSVDLLNPAMGRLFPGLRLAEFDIFSGRLERRPRVIKCANVLNGDYFSLEDIGRGLRNLHENLPDGGWLFLAHSNARYRDGEAYLALQRSGDGLVLREEANGHELLERLRGGAFPFVRASSADGQN